MEGTEIVTADTKEVIEQKEQSGSIANPFSTREGFQTILDIGKMFAASTLVPKAYQCKPMDCTIAVDMANRMGLSPMMVMQSLYIVQGTPTWSGQACMSLIQASGKYKDIEYVEVGTRGNDDWGCYVQAVDRSSGKIVKGEPVTMKLAKDEGWYGKSGSKWKTMPGQMMRYRAAAFFARAYCPNAMMGCRVEGENEDINSSHTGYVATDIYSKKGGKNE